MANQEYKIIKLAFPYYLECSSCFSLHKVLKSKHFQHPEHLPALLSSEVPMAGILFFHLLDSQAGASEAEVRIQEAKLLASFRNVHGRAPNKELRVRLCSLIFLIYRLKLQFIHTHHCGLTYIFYHKPYKSYAKF